jgi:hypothetical protein
MKKMNKKSKIILSVDAFELCLFTLKTPVELRTIILNYYYVADIMIEYLRRPSPYYKVVKFINANCMDDNERVIWSDVISCNPKDITIMINDFILLYMVESDSYAFELMLEFSNIESDELAKKKFTSALSARRFLQVIDKNGYYNKDFMRSNMLICPKKMRELYIERKAYYDWFYNRQKHEIW